MPMILRAVVLTGSFLAVACLTAAFGRLLFSAREQVVYRLASCAGRAPADRQRESVGESMERQAREQIYRLVGALGRVVSGRAYLAKIKDKLTKARVFIKAEELIGFCLVCGAAAFLIFRLLTGSYLFAGAAAIAGFKVPVMLVDRRRRRRMEALNRQLPDALDIICNGLRAGFSFPQAMSVLIQEMEPPITEEFTQVLRKNQLGKPMNDVLRELAAGTDSDDLEMVVTALLIQRQVGGNLAEILDNVSCTVRERLRIKGEIKTLTAQGRITALIISLLPAGVMAMLWAFSPQYIMLLFTELLGMVMFGTAVVLQILGIIALRKIIYIEV